MKKIAIGLIILLTAACGTSYRVTTDTFADAAVIPYGFPPGTSFSIAPVQKANPLLEKQVAHKIAAILENRGYGVSDQETDYQLLFNCKMTSEKVVVDVTEYVPGKTENRKGFVKDDKGKVSYEESSKVSAEWKKVPQETIHYAKEISIHVIDGKEEVWSGSAKSVGERGDLREAADYLLFSIMNHFGCDTKKSLVSHIGEKDLQ